MKHKEHRFHGQSRSRLYQVWASMLGRCKPSSRNRSRYYDRGITVCERWHEYEAFAADMGERPDAGYSIDRIDNNKGYEPGNCRWATVKEQGANTRKTVLVTALGETMPLRAWARVVGINHQTIAARLRSGMNPEDAILSPSQKSGAAEPRVPGLKRRRIMPDGSIQKFCKGCSRWVNLDECSRRAACPDGRAPKCKACVQARWEANALLRDERKTA